MKYINKKTVSILLLISFLILILGFLLVYFLSSQNQETGNITGNEAEVLGAYEYVTNPGSGGIKTIYETAANEAIFHDINEYGAEGKMQYLAVNDSGEMFAYWNTENTLTGDLSSYVEKLDNDGNEVGSTLTIAGSHIYSMITDNSNGFYVLLGDEIGTDQINLSLSRYDSDKNLLWNQPLNFPGTGSDWNTINGINTMIDLIHDTQGGVYAIYGPPSNVSTTDEANYRQEIYANHIASDGSVSWGTGLKIGDLDNNLVINPRTNYQYDAVVDVNGDLIVSWFSPNSDGDTTSTNKIDINVSKLDSNGNYLWGTSGISLHQNIIYSGSISGRPKLVLGSDNNTSDIYLLSPESNTYNAKLDKLDSNGNIISNTVINNPPGGSSSGDDFRMKILTDNKIAITNQHLKVLDTNLNLLVNLGNLGSTDSSPIIEQSSKVLQVGTSGTINNLDISGALVSTSSPSWLYKLDEFLVDSNGLTTKAAQPLGNDRIAVMYIRQDSQPDIGITIIELTNRVTEDSAVVPININTTEAYAPSNPGADTQEGSLSASIDTYLHYSPGGTGDINNGATLPVLQANIDLSQSRHWPNLTTSYGGGPPASWAMDKSSIESIDGINSVDAMMVSKNGNDWGIVYCPNETNSSGGSTNSLSGAPAYLAQDYCSDYEYIPESDPRVEEVIVTDTNGNNVEMWRFTGWETGAAVSPPVPQFQIFDMELPPYQPRLTSNMLSILKNYSGTGVYGENDVYLHDNWRMNPITFGELALNLEDNAQWNNIEIFNSSYTGKVVMNNIASAEGVQTDGVSLMVPSENEDDGVLYCPNATIPRQVREDCPGGEYVPESDARLTEIAVDGDMYWRLEASGEGGLMAMPPRGENIRYSSKDIFDIEEGTYVNSAGSGGTNITSRNSNTCSVYGISDNDFLSTVDIYNDNDSSSPSVSEINTSIALPMHSLTFSTEGKLYGITRDDAPSVNSSLKARTIYEIDVPTGTPTEVIELTSDTNLDVGFIEYNPQDNQIYYISGNPADDGETPYFVKIDPVTGNLVDIGMNSYSGGEPKDMYFSYETDQFIFFDNSISATNSDAYNLSVTGETTIRNTEIPYGTGDTVAVDCPTWAQSLEVVPQENSVRVGQTLDLDIEAKTIDDLRSSAYRGTVGFTSGSGANLPTDLSFTTNEDGMTTLSGALSFTEPGTYTITATDNHQNSITGTSNSITVLPSTVDLGLTASNTTIIEGDSITLDVTALDSDSNPDSNYEGTVTFSSDDSSLSLPSDLTFTSADNGALNITDAIVFSEPGTYTITITDTVDSTLTDTITITVLNSTASLTASINDTRVEVNEPVDITVQAIDNFEGIDQTYQGTITFTANGSGMTLPEDYTFTVSDSGEKKFENAIEFSNSGIYIVTVTDTVLGSLRADTQEIEVVLPSNNNTGGGGDSEAVTPEANFVADVRNGYPDLEVTFTDLSEGSPREWLWDFGDGNTSTEEDPRHIYSEPGSYNVTLQVTYANGSDIEIRNRYIEVYDAASCEPGELDADNDGLINSVEAEIGTACDDADSDDDRLDDKLERELGTNPLNSDSDNDGLEDGEEQIQDTDPLNEDTDGDGILDGEEILGCRFERRDNQIVPNTCEPGTVDTTDPLTFNDLESLSVDTSGNAQEDSTNDNLLRILAIIIILAIISRLIYLKYKSMNHERKSY